jgi:DNA-binding winged helix-turn-helix (wHTH) protein
MSRFRTNGIDRQQRRRWSFANCSFDEANWVLHVAGRRVPVEIKPLELLRALLLRAGNVVSKEELLDAVWPEVEVVEASLTTAVRKLRSAIGDDRRAKPIVETVQRIGYRLATPVKVEDVSGSPAQVAAAPPEPGDSPPIATLPVAADNRARFVLTIAAGLAIGLAAMALVLGSAKRAPGPAPNAFAQSDVADAVRNLDIDAIERMLAAGWDPSTPWDKEGTDAFTMLLNHCEWDPAHDRRKMLMMARVLLEAGIKIDRRNVFGDTPYSIAKAPRYCGPDHPVTQMLEAMCYGGDMGPKDLCLATYELTAEQRKAQGLPPKS